jgi:preprotein translocase subunit Sss1
MVMLALACQTVLLCLGGIGYCVYRIVDILVEEFG